MLREIRQQPPHIRALFMWLSVFIVFSLVVFVWFKSFEQKLAYLINSDKESETQTTQESPFSVIGTSFNDLRATILDLFGLARGTKEETKVIDDLEKRFKIEPKLLPVAE